MPTPTNNMALQKPTVGADVGTWGGLLNGNFDVLDTLAFYPLQSFTANAALAYDTVRPLTFVKGNATTSTISLTLPTAASFAGKAFGIAKVDGTTNSVFVLTTSAQTISGLANYELSNHWQYVVVVSDGSNWIVFANN